MFISPKRLKHRERPFDDTRYIFEPMIDGRRLILSMENGITRLFNRHGHDVTRQYPELHRVPIADNSDVVLDGELVCINPETGGFELGLVIERLRMSKPMNIMEAAAKLPVHLFVFDILRYRGEDLRDLPLTERKHILAESLEGNMYFSVMPAVEDAGEALFRAIRGNRLKGMAAKRKDSAYDDMRNEDWMKIINYNYTNVAIAGYRKNQFGWLIAQDERIVGIVERPVPSTYRQAFQRISKAIGKGEDRDYVYVEPSIAAQVRFRRWSKDGKLVNPEFVSFLDTSQRCFT